MPYVSQNFKYKLKCIYLLVKLLMNVYINDFDWLLEHKITTEFKTKLKFKSNHWLI